MARTEARILVSIWTDPDFRALSPNAQWAYVFLLSQPDLAHSGVLPLRVRRWAGAANGMTVTTLAESLRELERARFIIADRETEELMIRTFIRGDGVFRQPNLLRAARKHLAEVASPTLLSEIDVELRRCIPLADDKAKAELVGMVDDLAQRLPKASPNPSANPSPEASAMPLGERGVVTEVEMVSPSSFPLDPSPLPPSAAVALRDEPTAQTIVAEWIRSLPGKAPDRIKGQIARHVKALLSEGFDPDKVREGLAAWQEHGESAPSVLPSFVHQVTNGRSRASPNGHRPSTTDQRVANNLALADRFEAMEAP